MSLGIASLFSDIRVHARDVREAKGNPVSIEHNGFNFEIMFKGFQYYVTNTTTRESHTLDRMDEVMLFIMSH